MTTEKVNKTALKSKQGHAKTNMTTQNLNMTTEKVNRTTQESKQDH